jgi:hypothetical protein
MNINEIDKLIKNVNNNDKNDLDEIHLRDIVNHVDAYNHTNTVICCSECDYRDWLNSDLANMCDDYIIKILKGHKNE